MMHSGVLKVTTPSDREIALSRGFDAPRRLVFRALTNAALIPRWLTGPPGWSMTECTFDAKVGGAYRYYWKHENGSEMGLRGVVQEIVPPERIVVTERFDEAWYPGEALVTMALEEKDGATALTLTVRYESKEVRDHVLRSPMAEGVGYGYDRLAELVASMREAEGDAAR